MIKFISPVSKKALAVRNGQLVSESGEIFPIIKGIPRFVNADNYASAFGLQWNTFQKTQLDSYTKTNTSRERLERCLGEPLNNLYGKYVLEVGCGAGRFTELLVKAGANTHSVDLSIAVEANMENIGEQKNYVVAQADVYKLPFPIESFDYVICLGVIQHTPSPEKTIKSLWEMVKPGGNLVIDHYKWRLSFYSTPAPYVRFFLKKLKPALSQKITNKLVGLYFPIQWEVRNNKPLRWILKHLSPISEYSNIFSKLGKNYNYELAKLDTYDQLTDYYKHLRTPLHIKNILKKLGASEINVSVGGNGIEARCKKEINS